MTALLCCRRRPPTDMGAALSQEGPACELAGAPQPPTMADVIRERKKKAGGAALGTLRRRIVAAARRRDARPDRGCEHARFIRGVVSSWRLSDVQVLHAELEATAALRDLSTQAALARPPATTLPTDLRAAFTHRWWCDVELVGSGWSVPAHRAILAARSTYFRHLLPRYPNSRRVPLEGLPGVCASGGREALLGALQVIYEGTPHHCSNCKQWDRGTETDLDIINMENAREHSNTWSGSRSDSWRPRRCGCPQGQGQSSRRLLEQLGASPSLPRLHADMKYLLDSGEYADACLSFRGEGGGAGGVGGGGGGGGGEGEADLPCHRVVLAARSTLFRKVLSGGGSGPGSTKSRRVISVDEQVLPRRFAVALLHCAYTDQVDLSLIQRAPSSPTSASSSSSNTSWSMGRGGSAAAGARGQCAQLEDVFQLYEIARFVEMPILAQGCEDLAAAQLSPATLPRVLRWSVAAHASAWLHRQAMRYLVDEWWAVMSSPHCGRVPRAALAAALRSPALQASELQALRGLLRWADHTEPNVVWHTSQAGAGGAGAAGAGAGAGAMARRGARAGRRRDVSDASVRQTIADLVGLIRLEHIPPDNDVLQQAIRRGVIPQPPAGCEGAEGAGVTSGAGAGARGSDAWLTQRPPRAFLPYLDEIKALLDNQSLPEADLFRARRARCLQRIPDTLYMVSGPSATSAESRCVPAALQRALRLRQRELRAAAPAAAAATLPLIDLHELHRQIALRCVREMALPDSCADLLLNDKDEQPDREGSWSESEDAPPSRDASRRDYCCRSAAAGGGGSQGSLRSVNSDQHSINGRSGHSSPPLSRREYLPGGGQGGHGAGREGAVPDVALPPNGNTHLLAQHTHSYGGMGVGVLQLDLGDGATHTPRPGSRALRAASQQSRNYREQLTFGRSRILSDDDELRAAAMELSLMRAYSSYGGGAGGGHRAHSTSQRHTLQHPGQVRRVSPSPAATPRPRPPPPAPSDHLALRGADVGPEELSPAQRRARHYRLDPASFGGSSHSSRGPSPNNYA